MNVRYAFAGSLLFALPILACDNAPGAGKTGATVNEAVTAPAASSTGAATKYTFTQAASKITFVGAKVTGKNTGEFEAFHGTIIMPGNEIRLSSVTAEIDISSLRANDPKLTNHLKSPDLLDATKYPKARFTSTKLEPSGSNDALYTVTGNLELHGVTKSIGFPASIRAADGRVDVAAEFSINRKNFGVVYPGMPDDLIKDDVLLQLKIRASRDERPASSAQR